MDKLELPQTDFTPLKKPEKPQEGKELEKTEYLDELYSKARGWMNTLILETDLRLLNKYILFTFYKIACNYICNHLRRKKRK